MWIIAPFILVALISAAIVSTYSGPQAFRADVVFLMLVAWTAVVFFLRSAVINKIDTTNDNDTSIIAIFFIVVVTDVCVIIACLATLLAAKALVAFVAAAVLITITAVWTGWMHA